MVQLTAPDAAQVKVSFPPDEGSAVEFAANELITGEVDVTKGAFATRMTCPAPPAPLFTLADPPLTS
jgi:hypothetical protein